MKSMMRGECSSCGWGVDVITLPAPRAAITQALRRVYCQMCGCSTVLLGREARALTEPEQQHAEKVDRKRSAA
jgi:hypothetical protein